MSALREAADGRDCEFCDHFLSEVYNHRDAKPWCMKRRASTRTGMQCDDWRMSGSTLPRHDAPTPAHLSPKAYQEAMRAKR